MGNEAIPFRERKRRIGGSKHGNEMVFKRPDGTLGSIGLMLRWRDSLKSNVIFLE